ALKQIPDFSLEICPENFTGDLSTNLAFLLAKTVKMPPVKIGELIVEALKADKAVNKIIEKIELVDRGFVNFSVEKDALYKELQQICRQKTGYGRQDIGRNKKVQIEFVSANPTGPLHIGHGRGAAIGDSLARILKAAGYDVQKEYYINNRGTQINLLGESVRARYKELKGKKIEFPEQGYKGEYIKDIAAEIAAQNKKVDEDNLEFFKEFAINNILTRIKSDLEMFGVSYERWFIESEMYKNKEVDQVISRLKEQDYIYEQDKAFWFKSTAFGDEKDRVVVRSDGEPTYLASDITYHYDKFKRGFEKVVDIWGADHHGYVARVQASVQALGYPADRLKVILYQLVSLSREGKPQPMSTRAGEFVTLREVINEVGKDACRFFFLMRGANSHLDFDLELAKKQSPDNPVYYVQYAHARIWSIFKEAQKSEYKLTDEDGKNLALLKEAEEQKLINKLVYFPELVALSARTYDPHWVTVYLQELARIFHNYYQKHRVITGDKNLTLARLFLIQATGVVLSEGLNLIGVKAPEKM
ncbi:MAG: arginine--tRNA ligase, partial [bacterium]